MRRTAAIALANPSPPTPARPSSPIHFYAPSVIPAQAGTQPHTPPHPSSPIHPSPSQRASAPIHPSPLPGGRLGGGWAPASVWQPLATTSITPPCLPYLRPLRHTYAPSVIPAQAGTKPTHTSAPLFPNSSLPPKRGEARWGVGAHECAAAARHHLNRPSPLPSFLRRQEPSHTHLRTPLPQFIPPP